MIGKLVEWFKNRKEPTKYVKGHRKFTDPTYPPDLAEMFPENRNETHTDTCLWQSVEPEDKG